MNAAMYSVSLGTYLKCLIPSSLFPLLVLGPALIGAAI